MFTEKEKEFINYWEQQREAENKFTRKLFGGLPMAILFTLPIIIFIIVVWLFFPDWYMKISKTSSGMFVTAIFALIVVTLFYSFFRMQFKWEANEQYYKELKAKQLRQKNIFTQNQPPQNDAT